MRQIQGFYLGNTRFNRLGEMLAAARQEQADLEASAVAGARAQEERRRKKKRRLLRERYGHRRPSWHKKRAP